MTEDNNQNDAKQQQNPRDTTASLQLLLSRPQDEVAASVLTFPGEYCGSVAIGCFRLVVVDADDQNKHKVVFCKDRNRDEAILQQAGAQLGKAMFPHANVVASCESLDRPQLEDLLPGSAGAKMWNLKEDQWKRIYQPNKDKNDDEDDTNDDKSTSSSCCSSSVSSMATAPSAHDCWLLEEAVQYYHPTRKSNSRVNGRREEHSAFSSPSSVDASLRRKLRRAANQSVSGCLDLVALLMLTEKSQTYVRGSQPAWTDYQETHLIHGDAGWALTADETKLLWQDKLIGAGIQRAMLFTMILGLPDAHCGNLAVKEDEEGIIGNSRNLGGTTTSWRLKLVHFDIGLASPNAGVSLDALKLAYHSDRDSVDYEHDFDFAGGPNGRAYYYPILFSSVFSNCSNAPLEAVVRRELLEMDARALQHTARDTFGKDDPFDANFGQRIGKVFQQRVEMLQDYARSHPSCSCRDLVYHTITAWKRDYAVNEKYEVFVEWLRDVKEWAGVET